MRAVGTIVDSEESVVFVVALIILVVAVLLLAAGLFGGGGDAHLDLGSFNLSATSSVVFFLGMATLLLFVLSIAMMRSAGRRAKARRKERKKVGELSEKLEHYKREHGDREAGDGRHTAPAGGETTSGSATSAETDASAEGHSTDTGGETPRNG